jgi:hypothetical protein
MRPIPAGVKEGGPDRLSETHSLGRVIAEAREHPVHIVFVHGIRADGPGTSAYFRQGLCRHVQDLCPDGAQPPLDRSTRFDLGDRPLLEYLGEPVWRNDMEWRASWPFVDRYVYRRRDAPPVVVDEVNWWPLLFALKSRVLVWPEVDLSGADKTHLLLCSSDTPPYFPFLDRRTVEERLARPPLSGGAARLNADLKQQLMNWGFADATIAIGPVRRYLHRAMEAAFSYAAGFEAYTPNTPEFVVVAESLGGFVVLDAYSNLGKETETLRQVVTNATDLYLFANQFALLALTRLREPPNAAAPAGSTPRAGLLRHWAMTPTPAKETGPSRPRQIIAFNDPSDALTFNVPALLNPDGSRAAIVANLYCRNELNFFGLFADPIAAHTGYSRNPAVLRTVFAKG